MAAFGGRVDIDFPQFPVLIPKVNHVTCRIFIRVCPQLEPQISRRQLPLRSYFIRHNPISRRCIF
jgi:hypothetical protein